MECPHLGDSIKIDRDFIKTKKLDLSSIGDGSTGPTTGVAASATISGKQWRCSECTLTQENWMCLNCGSILCGRYINGHALSHSKDNVTHAVCLNTLNSSVFCYACDDFVINDTDTNALDDLRQEFREFDDTSSEASTYLDDASVVSSSSKSQQQQHLLQQHHHQQQLHESRSTSSSDSGCGTEEPTTPAAPLPPPSLATPPATTATTAAGRKLRPRKRTISCDSTDAAKRKTLRKVVGLRNLGNTCFMNSVLQSLSNIQEFSCYFSALPSLAESTSSSSNKQPKRVYHSRSLKENSGVNSDANVVEELRKILTNLSHGGDGSKAISPECLFLVIWKVVPQFRGHRQHDAHEFLRYMLDRLHTELQNLVIPTIEQISGKNSKIFNISSAMETGGGSIMFKGRSSIVTSVFGGTLQSEVRCLFCGMESKKHDPFLDLSLDIPEKFYKESDEENQPVCHIADCLSSFTEIEELAETELYYCSSCKCKQKSTKRFWIRRLPNVLCLHIKRFRWNNFFRTKIDLRISFPIKSMDMSQFVLNNGPETRRSSAGNNVYDLAAVIVHHGNGSSCGHYTSFAINNGTWLHFNDHTVKEVQPSAVAECKPYILFYIRRDMNKTL